MRDTYRAARTRAGSVFRNHTVEVSEPYAGNQGQPGKRLVLIFQKSGLQLAGRALALSQRGRRTIVGDQIDELMVSLPEHVKACRGVVLGVDHIQRHLRPAVLRCAVLRGADRVIVGIAVKIRGVVVIERRCGEQNAGPESMYPGEVGEGISLAYDIADAG